MNGSTGIQPTVELATTNGNGYGYPYPVMPFYSYGNGNNGGFFGGDGIWALVLLALLFNGNNGFGFGNNWGGNNLATTDFVSSEFTQRDISQLSNTTTNGFGNLSTQLCNCCSDINSNIASGFANNATNLCNLKSEVLENRYANQLAESQTQRDILLQTTQLENQAGMNALSLQGKLDSCCCDLRAQGLENTQRILDALNQNTIADLREKLNEAQTEISNRNIESSIINSVRPYPTPAWLVSSPYQSLYNGYGFNGFYGNGFYGNTII